ncbi:MAG: ABC transporter ATP-binding protein [Desulfohalobiaceae bacterium]|nr:ABC transporter ATP-binding protein [Desulfohalobiaceae bacterium]
MAEQKARPDSRAGPDNAEPLLSLKGLTMGFRTDEGSFIALEDVSYEVPKGQTVGLVGESGCGKSVSVMTAMRLLPSPPAFIRSGQVVFDGRDLLKLVPESMRHIRGNRIGMIFQEPMTSLNPTFSIGFQMREVLRIHRSLKRKEADELCTDMLAKTGIGAPAQRLKQYPHELSGGLRQRIMIAMALLCGPDLLIADEPTTALDVTIQAQILELLKELQQDLQMSILMITHDLGVVAESCRYVYVMYAGCVVESAEAERIFSEPGHPYTRGLINSRPRIAEKREWLKTIPGMVPGPDNRPPGCNYAERCERCTEQCRQEQPQFVQYDHKQAVACWNPYP